MTYHVSQHGDDSFTGAAEKPVKTLEKALELARTQTGSRTIQIEKGVYEDVSVTLDSRDSGLTLRAEGHTSLCGGRSVTGWTKCTDGSYKTNLPADIPLDFRLITVNGRLCERARFPEEGLLEYKSKFTSKWMSTSAGGWDIKPTLEQLTTLEYDPANIDADFNWQNADLTVFHRWDDSMAGIIAHEPDKHLFRLASPLTHPPGSFERNTYIIWNTQEGMAPGKWRVDRQEGVLYYMPLSNEDMPQLKVIVPTHNSIIDLEGKINDLTVEGLGFIATSSPTTACGFGTADMTGAVNSTAILSNCTFRNLTFTGLSCWGINLNRDKEQAHAQGDDKTNIEPLGNKNVIVENCTITDVGGGGIQLIGNSGCVVRNNKVTRAGRIYFSAIGIYTSDCDIIENDLWDLPYSGICSGGGKKGARVCGNRVSNVLKLLNDGAGIYVTFCDDGIMSGNFVENIPSEDRSWQRHGLYIDEQANGWVAEGNITMNCPSAFLSHMNYKGGNIIRNNVFACHNGDLMLTFIRCEDHKLEGNTFHAKGTITFAGSKGVVTQYENNRVYSAEAKINHVYVDDDYSWSEPIPLSGQIPLE